MLIAICEIHQFRLQFSVFTMAFFILRSLEMCVLKFETVLKVAFCTYVRTLLEFSSQIWSPYHRYLNDKIESLHRFFAKKLSSLQNLTYLQRLKVLGL